MSDSVDIIRRAFKEVDDEIAALRAERDTALRNALLAGSELDWLVGYLSETDEHAAEHARRARAALGAAAGEPPK